MILNKLFDANPTGVLEQALRFTEARQGVLADDVANVSTPGFRQKDLSLTEFQAMLQKHVDAADRGDPAAGDFSDVAVQVDHPTQGILFHDGNNRSMEKLQSDSAKNAMMHNLIVELLRRQYQTLDMALKEKVT